MTKTKTGKKSIFIITGLSGAGKTKALQTFGDFGFYCVDNLPIALFEPFFEHLKSRKEENIALGIDIREGKDLKILPAIINEIKEEGFKVKVVFLNASDAKLVQRFSETKHKHPIQKKLVAAIEHERKQLKPLQTIADKEIDTTNLTLGELKEKLSKLLNRKEESEMQISVLSFGFKNGIPLEADLVMDVRFLPNPFYIKDLKAKTGLDAPVGKYIMSHPEAPEFLERYSDMLKFLIPKYMKEGKSYLTIAIGCTGGKHRSVFMAHELSKVLKKEGLTVSEYHRDIKV
ncbi:UPF0042 nucleotide-binding protein [Elusimicrobium posterum]|uniref:RNase adapter RapZ n=1 Tax=Elusimicrobium posterum TaxID=3116653 RepID=UPI003C74E2C3